MKISIITICYNNECDIRPTLESVVNQTYQNIEYVIVDGASKDRTMKIVGEYKDKIAKIISEPDKGLYDAINKGIKNATGDIVGLIHAGDELIDDTIVEKIVSHFHNNDIDAVFGHSKIFSMDSQKIVRVNRSPKYKRGLFRIGWFPSHQSFYVKRELFEKLGYYKLKYRIASDYELLLRFLYINKIKVKLLDAYIVKFKMGGTSTKSLSNIIKLNKECIQAWSDNNLRIPFYTIPLKIMRKAIQIIVARIN